MKQFIFIFLLFSIISQTSVSQSSNNSESQEVNPSATRTSANIGLGLGLTYGGIGGRFVFNPIKDLGLFLGLGYNFIGLGYNLGAIYSFPSQGNVHFYLSGMYGYNSIILIADNDDLSKTYFGPSFGVGIKLKSKNNPGNYWDFGLILPIRSSSFNDDMEEMKNRYSDLTDPWPVLINIGYNFKL